MSDLLVQRLKAAKRELTALKTAHRRGIGNLKIYNRYCEELGSHTTGTLNITIKFDSKYAAYPLFQVLPLGDISSSGMVYTGVNANYANGGYQASVQVYDEFAWLFSYGFYVLSTAPTTEVNYSY